MHIPLPLLILCRRLLWHNRADNFGEEGIALSSEDPYEFEVPVKKSRLLLYSCIALIVALLAYLVLVAEPSMEWPQNLIHLLGRH
jgi:hypothetical protein